MLNLQLDVQFPQGSNIKYRPGTIQFYPQSARKRLLPDEKATAVWIMNAVPEFRLTQKEIIKVKDVIYWGKCDVNNKMWV